MKRTKFRAAGLLSAAVFIAFVLNSCTKDPQTGSQYDLDVLLLGGKSQGYLKFRQDPDAAKIINLDIKVAHLTPNHAYLLQRAVDDINVLDGNCTSTTWLTLGKALTPQAITTDNSGNGEETLWRDVTAIPTGSTFDIHFQVVDATSLVVVFTSDCYQYKVR
jgi:hypothetical protein